MRPKADIISLLTDPGIIAVVRAQQAAQVLPLSEALIAGGVRAIEITMTTPNALAAIRGPRELLTDLLDRPDQIQRALADVERRKIQLALDQAGGDVGRASEILQVDYRSLAARLGPRHVRPA